MINFFILFRSQCHLEYDACIGRLDIKPIHMGECNNCHNVTCPFNGQCRSNQGNYTCSCPARSTCPPARVCSVFSPYQPCIIKYERKSVGVSSKLIKFY